MVPVSGVLDFQPTFCILYPADDINGRDTLCLCGLKSTNGHGLCSTRGVHDDLRALNCFVFKSRMAYCTFSNVQSGLF